MQLARRLNLFDATLLVIGNVVGAGIFTTSGFLAGELPQPSMFIGIWIIGGLLTLCGALTYAELAAMFPHSGGDYQFLKAAYGPWAGYLLGWVSFWIINPGSIAALSIALVSYLKGFFPFGTPVLEKASAIGIIVFLSLVNCRGVRWSGTSQDIFTIGNLVIIVIFVAGGLVSMKGDYQHFTASSVSLPLSKLLGPAMIAVIFTYSGWFVTAYIGGEIKNPGRNLPLSLLMGTAIVTVLYTLINMTYLYAIPIHELKGAENVAQVSAESVFNKGFGRILSFSVMLAIAASINATILAGARISYAMASDNIFWTRLKTLHPFYHTPYISILTQMILSCLFVIAGTFSQLLSYVVFVMILSSIATGMAHLILRKRKPELSRPYRTWGYPVIPVLFVVVYVWIAVQIALDMPGTSLIGILIALSGLPFYWKYKEVQREV
ncbi:MAG: amino acid permease [Thermodesulfovibrionales bacterium]